MKFYAFMGVGVTSATRGVFGQVIWDPGEWIQCFHSPVLLVRALMTITIATMSRNIEVFLPTTKLLPKVLIAPIFFSVYRFVWFVGFGLAFISSLLLKGFFFKQKTAYDVILSEAKRSRRIPLN